MSSTKSQVHEGLWDLKEVLVQLGTSCVKRWRAFLQRASHWRPKFSEFHVEIDPSFEELIGAFGASHEAFQRAEELFWKLRVHNAELTEQLRVVRIENAFLRERVISEHGH
jgi:hypothetical protein